MKGHPNATPEGGGAPMAEKQDPTAAAAFGGHQPLVRVVFELGPLTLAALAHLTNPAGGGNPGQTDTLNQILHNTRKIMADVDTALKAIQTINDATTAQGVTLAAEAATLQTISDEVDKLISNVPIGTIPADVLQKLQDAADHVALVSASVQKNADFSTAVASKGAGTPVPVPVPVPTAPPAKRK